MSFRKAKNVGLTILLSSATGAVVQPRGTLQDLPPLPWRGLSQPRSGAGRVPGRLGLHCQLRRLAASKSMHSVLI